VGAKKEKNIGKVWQDNSIIAWRHFWVDFMAAFAIVEVGFLPKLNLHRKGAPACRQAGRAQRLGFSLAGERRKGGKNESSE